MTHLGRPALTDTLSSYRTRAALSRDLYALLGNPEPDWRGPDSYTGDICDLLWEFRTILWHATIDTIGDTP